MRRKFAMSVLGILKKRKMKEESMNYDKCVERYKNNAEFNRLVNIFYSLMAEQKLTIIELKDALLFAGIKFEQENIRPIAFAGGEANFI